MKSGRESPEIKEELDNQMNFLHGKLRENCTCCGIISPETPETTLNWG